MRLDPRLLLSLLWLLPAAVSAEEPYTPPDLEPWVDWVLEDTEVFGCPFVGNQDPGDEGNRICAWPGVLEIEVEGNTARFSQRWTTFRDQHVPLPGRLGSWPNAVAIDGRTDAVVAGHRNSPRVWLTEGTHEVTGKIEWERRPATVWVPTDIGIVRLIVDGRRIEHPQRNRGNLWLGERPRETQAPEKVSVRVYRRLSDGLPKTLETRLELEVSGRGREVVLARVLPVEFLPTRLTGELPARIDPDGRLRVQVRAGFWELALMARATGEADEVTLEPGEGPWATEEIWSWQADPLLRITEPAGASPVDPDESQVPPEWHELPAFRLLPGESLSITERARGDQGARENELALTRQLWLDFDGEGWTAVDSISGAMHRDWRLDMATPWSLASARTPDRSLLVTRGEVEGESGVELRDPRVAVDAVARIEGVSGTQPATGWQAAFRSLRTVVTLPPGHLLLHAGGADDAGRTWLSRWQLFDFFLLLVIVVAVARLYGPPYGALAFVMLALVWQEPGAPHWPWLTALAAIALARVAPEGRLRRSAVTFRALALAALVLTFLPWAGQQARLALHPQLDRGTAAPPAEVLRQMAEEERIEFLAPSAIPQSATMEDEASYGPTTATGVRRHTTGLREAGPTAVRIAPQDKVTVTGSRIRRADLLSPFAPDALLQTGPGIPAWRGPSYLLTWSGRVTPDEELRLFVLGETGYRLLRVLGILLAGLLIARLAADAIGGLRARFGSKTGVLPVLAVVALVGLPTDSNAASTLPDQKLLQELRNRLLEPPPCAPRCVSLASAEVGLDEASLRIRLEIHAAADVAVPTPWIEGWQPETVLLDGRALRELHGIAGDSPKARVPEGIHMLELRGTIPAVNELRLVFPLPPHRARVLAVGWDVGGLQNGRVAEGSLQFSRRLVVAEQEQAGLEPSQFPAFVTVNRAFTLDLDWSVLTEVSRVAPQEAPFSVSIPLVPGEAPQIRAEDEGRLEVVDDQVRGTFGLGTDAIAWGSDLPATATLTLTAPADLSREEVWEITTGNIWRVRFEGTPALEVPAMTLEYGTWVARFRPRPGETLTIHAERVTGLEGETLAIDRAVLAVKPGKRTTDSELTINYRSTRGGRHTLMLPPDARVTRVAADGETLNLRPEEGRVSVPVLPGRHQLSVAWEQGTDGRTRVETPVVALGTMAANVQQRIEVGQGRWTLFAFGPGKGPAILYWSELALFLVIAFLLGRTRYAPVKTWEWLLLGLGFSTFAWEVLILVAVWLFATGWRSRATMPEKTFSYNAIQFGYAGLTVITVLTLLSSVPMALLGNPRMHILGQGSNDRVLSWFSDRVDGELAAASLVSVPLWVYQAAILLWALWLAFAVIRWLRSSWSAWSAGGLWRGKVKLPLPKRSSAKPREKSGGDPDLKDEAGEAPT